MNPHNSHISHAISSAREDDIARFAATPRDGGRVYLASELAPGIAAVAAALLAVVIGAPLAA